MNDLVRAAVLGFVQSFLNMLVLLKVVELDADQLGGINLFVGNAMVVIFLFWKTGQGKAPLPTGMVVGEDKAQTKLRKDSE